MFLRDYLIIVHFKISVFDWRQYFCYLNSKVNLIKKYLFANETFLVFI